MSEAATAFPSPGGALRSGLARLRASLQARPTPEGIRITKVGLWFVVFAIVVAAAATNTGNNALYMVLAAMLGLLVVSGVVSRANLRALAVSLDPPAELFAGRPVSIGFTLRHAGRWWPRWLLLVSLDRGGAPRLVPFLPPGAAARGGVDLLFPRRGWQAVPSSRVHSLFPLGLFRKGLRYPATQRLLVYPELFAPGSVEREAAGVSGEQSSRRIGWGHELHSLRAFRPGDDPRAIHWKQTARTGQWIVTEREAEETVRLSILFDNGASGRLDAERAARFEVLVSEAATAAVDFLERGYEVELIARDARLPFGGGPRQRRAILETLALIAPVVAGGEPLAASDPWARLLRLSLSEGR